MIKKIKKLIPVTGPWITEKEVRYVAQAARDGWNENYLKYITLFEKKFAEYVGRKYALATSSCTGALHLSFLALGLKKGDDVIVPNITWIATVEPLYWMGIKPIFADIEPDTWCIDPKDIEKKITKKTKAILVVDLYGHVADMKPILKIAKKYNLKIIEDAAEAVGSEYYGKKAGSFGDVSVFSFHGSKTMVTGEGGMLLTDNKKIIEKAKYYNDHCKDKKKNFWNLEIGYKYKMSNFQAACGLAQLERINELIEKKRQIFFWYKERLSKIPGIQLNVERLHTKNTYWMVTIVWDKKYKINKEKLIKEFKKYNIQVRPFFYPLSSLPAINCKADTPVSFDISSRSINLPCGLNITEKAVDYISNILIKILIKK
jgi:perosamine synthetase